MSQPSTAESESKPISSCRSPIACNCKDVVKNKWGVCSSCYQNRLEWRAERLVKQIGARDAAATLNRPFVPANEEPAVKNRNTQQNGQHTSR